MEHRADTPKRSRVTNETKLKIIEESKKKGFSIEEPDFLFSLRYWKVKVEQGRQKNIRVLIFLFTFERYLSYTMCITHSLGWNRPQINPSKSQMN